jgi:hypothetical protein
MNIYTAALVERSKSRSQIEVSEIGLFASINCISSFLYPTFLSEGFERVKRYTKKVFTLYNIIQL